MSNIIKYQNILSEDISEQQALLLDNYSKLFFEDGDLKKEEVYRNKILWGGTYYLSATENIIDVLNELGPELKWSICTDKEVISGYTVYTFRNYDAALQEKAIFHKKVVDINEKHIATGSFDTQTLVAISAFKKFHFGGQSVPDDDPDVFFSDDAKVSFSFDDNGNIKSIRMNVEYVNNGGSWDSVAGFQIQAAEFIDEMMTPAQFTYFTNLEPLVPNF